MVSWLVHFYMSSKQNEHEKLALTSNISALAHTRFTTPHFLSLERLVTMHDG